MRWKRMAVMLVGAGVVFGGVYGFVQFRQSAISEFFANQPAPVISVTAAKAVSEAWHTTIPTVGTLRAVSGVDITSSVAGVVEEILFESGGPAEQGEALVRLDSDIEQANLEAAQAQFEMAQANFERSSALREGVVSQATLDQNRFEMQARAAQVAALQAQIDKKTIRAPFDGVLGIRRVDIGQFVQPGEALVNLQNLDTLLVEFSVGQRDLAAVKPGRTIRVVADSRPGGVFEGVVTSLEPRVDPATGMVQVEGNLPNPEGDLVPGVFVDVEVELADEQQVVVVPQSAVSYNLYGDFVYIVQPPAEGEEHPTVARSVVETGPRRDGKVAILSGVEDGDTVVTSGQLRLSNGASVEVAEEPLGQPDVTQQLY